MNHLVLLGDGFWPRSSLLLALSKLLGLLLHLDFMVRPYVGLEGPTNIKNETNLSNFLPYHVALIDDLDWQRFYCEIHETLWPYTCQKGPIWRNLRLMFVLSYNKIDEV